MTGVSGRERECEKRHYNRFFIMMIHVCFSGWRGSSKRDGEKHREMKTLSVEWKQPRGKSLKVIFKVFT